MATTFTSDRNGVRTPMQWDGGWNGGFSTADPKASIRRLCFNPVYGYRRSTSSRRAFRPLAAFLDERIVKVRKSTRVRPRIHRVLYPANHRILAYVRQLEKESILW